MCAAAGGKAVFGTNPIAFGIPQAGAPPMTFDMATSAIALFGVLTAKAKGEPLPEGVAYKADGSEGGEVVLTVDYLDEDVAWGSATISAIHDTTQDVPVTVTPTTFPIWCSDLAI